MKEFRLCAFADEAARALDEQIVAMQRHAIDLLELRAVDGVNVACIGEKSAREIHTRLLGEGITVWSIGSPIGKAKVTDEFAPQLEAAKHIFGTANALQCDKVRVFSFFTCDYSKDRNTVIDRLCEFDRVASTFGLRLFHENEKGIYGDTAARCADILDSVPRLGCVYDPANFIQVGENVGLAMDMLLNRADYLHVKDALYAGGEVVPCGCGDGQIGDMLKRKGGGVITLEPHLTLFDGYQAIDTTQLKNKYVYPSGAAAFDAAAEALKKVLRDIGRE